MGRHYRNTHLRINNLEMSDFVPPSGPPPPKVPEGWKAQWNEQYSEWFYVNIYTKKSQWDKPTEPVYPPPSDGAPPGAPPGYSGGGQPQPTDTKHNPYESSMNPNTESDAALAARLQAEEDQRARSGQEAEARNKTIKIHQFQVNHQAMVSSQDTVNRNSHTDKSYLLGNKRRAADF